METSYNFLILCREDIKNTSSNLSQQPTNVLVGVGFFTFVVVMQKLWMSEKQVVVVERKVTVPSQASHPQPLNTITFHNSSLGYHSKGELQPSTFVQILGRKKIVVMYDNPFYQSNFALHGIETALAKIQLPF